MPKSRKIGGTGCLMLFALPFAAVGVGMTYWAAHIVFLNEAMQLLVEVPAVITQVDLKENDDSDGTTYRATAVYKYKFGGQQFTGERVSIHGGSDNIGRFQRDVYRELKRHHDQKKSFRCFVNPSDPSEAVLYRDLRGEMLAFYTLFATVFGSAGFALLIGSLVAARRMPSAAKGPVPENEPWQARSDWAAGQINSTGGAGVAVPVLTVVAPYWFIASGPLLWKLPEVLSSAKSPWAWATLVFPAIGLLLIAALAYHYLQKRKFGESTLQLAATPGVVGGQLAGVVHIPVSAQADEGFRLQLNCIERTKNSDNDTHEKIIWQDERVVTQPLDDGAVGTAVPVLFAIPYDAMETSRPQSARDIEWRLDVSAKLPGVDYKSRFEVPVFKTAESQTDFRLDKQLASEFSAAPPRELLLREAGIERESLAGGGVRLIFPALRNLASSIVLTAFLAVWGGAIWFMLHMRAPLIFPIVFGLFELLIAWVVIDLWFYRSVVEARTDGLTFRGGLLGLNRKRYWPAEDINRFTTSDAMSSGTQVWKNVVLVPRNGRKRTLAHSINGKLAQQTVIDELNAALGRGTDDATRSS